MAKEDFNFFLHSKVRYSEVDHQGIVYNSHYLGYADEATVAYLNKINFRKFLILSALLSLPFV